MKVINTEDIICSLFSNGFDKVDSILYVLVEGAIASLGDYKIEDAAFSSRFTNYVAFDGYKYYLKNNMSLDSNVLPQGKGYYPLREVFGKNTELNEYLGSLNYEDLINRKIEEIGIEKIKNFKDLFSNKEKEIMCKMYGITEQDVIGSKKLIK